ncbi:hypothetical protein [Haliangium sp.]|uniref:hypothetical protein n=1 Tax=Haliangium sp. TaxID=2663208 RepID=UPI003D1371F6
MTDSPQFLYVLVVSVLVMETIVLLTLRVVLHRVERQIVAHNPRRRGDTAEGNDYFGDDATLGSPLADVFRRYSLLTDRMADLVFELTAQRNQAVSSVDAAAPENSPGLVTVPPQPSIAGVLTTPDSGGGSSTEPEPTATVPARANDAALPSLPDERTRSKSGRPPSSRDDPAGD